MSECGEASKETDEGKGGRKEQVREPSGSTAEREGAVATAATAHPARAGSSGLCPPMFSTSVPPTRTTCARESRSRHDVGDPARAQTRCGGGKAAAPKHSKGLGCEAVCGHGVLSNRDCAVKQVEIADRVDEVPKQRRTVEYTPAAGRRAHESLQPISAGSFGPVALHRGLAWLGLAWLGLAWLGLAWPKCELHQTARQLDIAAERARQAYTSVRQETAACASECSSTRNPRARSMAATESHLPGSSSCEYLQIPRAKILGVKSRRYDVALRVPRSRKALGNICTGTGFICATTAHVRCYAAARPAAVAGCLPHCPHATAHREGCLGARIVSSGDGVPPAMSAERVSGFGFAETCGARQRSTWPCHATPPRVMMQGRFPTWPCGTP